MTGDHGVEVGADLAAKPEIRLPDGAPPRDLVIDDVVVGDGDAAAAGDRVTTHYVGVSWSKQREFDASWNRGKTLSFGLDQVISGWGRGIPGMRVGGRRLLIVPPDLAYGDAPPPGAGILPGETLVFVVDLHGTG